MKQYLFIFIIVVFGSCNSVIPTQFSKEALEDKIISIDKKEIPFKIMLEKHKGKKVVIDFWASWCGDCIRGLPKVTSLQTEYKDVVFVFLSIDDSYESWGRGISKYNIKGEHYLLPSGDDGSLGSFIDLDWIPRYMIINTDGTIQLFEAVEANDKRIIEALKN